jgi:hypothetical protein
MTKQILETGVPWDPGLDNDLPDGLAPACPSRHLHHLLKQGLGGPEIDAEQPLVSIDNTYQGHIGKIMPLGQ